MQDTKNAEEIFGVDKRHKKHIEGAKRLAKKHAKQRSPDYGYASPKYDVKPLWRHEKPLISKGFLGACLAGTIVLLVGLGFVFVRQNTELTKYQMIQDCVINQPIDYRGCYFQVTGELWPAPDVLDTPEPTEQPPEIILQVDPKDLIQA